MTAAPPRPAPGSAGGGRPSRSRTRLGALARSEERSFYLFIAPWLIGFVLFSLFPMIASLVLAFTDYDLGGWPNFVGFANFARMVDPIQGPVLAKAISNTLTIALIVVPLQVILGLGLAILLNQRVRGMQLFRTAFYLPSVVAGVATIMVWVWILGNNGILNQALALLGVDGPTWLRDPRTIKFGIAIMMIWGGTGGMMLIFLAGLQSMPTDLLDAASVDGAGPVGRFRHVTLPLITPQIFFNLVLGLAGGLAVFTETFVLSAGSGGPANETLTLVMYIYAQLMKNLQVGYASAVAWLFTIAVVALTAIQFTASQRWVYYEGER